MDILGRNGRNGIRRNRNLRLLKQVRQLELSGKFELRSLSERKLQKRLNVKSKEAKFLLHDIKMRYELASVKTLSKEASQVLINEYEIDELADLTLMKPTKLAGLLLKANVAEWQDLPIELAVRHAESILTEIQHLHSGRTLRQELPTIPLQQSAFLASAGVWTAADLAGTRLSTLITQLQISKSIIPPERLKEYKHRSHLYVGALVPPLFIEVLWEGGIKTLLDLANRNPKDVFKLLMKYYLSSSAKQREHLRKEIEVFRIRIGIFENTDSILASAPVSVARFLIHTKQAAVDHRSVGEYLRLAAEAWLELAKIAVEIQWYPLLVGTSCGCKWEDSIFSEKGYLGYLINTFGYTLDEIQNRFKVPLGTASEYMDVPPGCVQKTTVQEAIIKIQEDLRKQFNQNILEKDLNHPERRYLTYDEWLAHMLDTQFPENKFGRLFANGGYESAEATFHLFPGESDSYQARIEKIEQFYLDLKASFASMRLLPSIWASHNEVYSGEVVPESGNIGDIREEKGLNQAKPGYESSTVLYLNQEDLDAGHYDLTLRCVYDNHRQKPLKGKPGQGSVFTNVANAIRELLYIYNGILEASRSGYIDENWNNCGYSDTSILEKIHSQHLPKLLEILDDVFDSPSAKTVLSHGEPIETVFKNLRKDGRAAYLSYKASLVGLDYTHEHGEKVRRIVQSLLLIFSSSPIPQDEGLFRDDLHDTFPLLGQRLSHTITNGLFLWQVNGRRKPILELSKDVANESEPWRPGFTFKNFGESFPNEEIYTYLTSYSHFFAQKEQLGGAQFRNVSELLATQALIKERLKLVFEYGPGMRINWINLSQLFFNLMYHLPYLKHFLIPMLRAEYERSQHRYDAAIAWMTLVLDLNNTSAIKPVTPFRLYRAEENAAKLLVAGIWLDEAETLFRRNNAESIQNAKEIYQRILRLFPECNCCLDDRTETIARFATAVLKSEAPLIQKLSLHRLITEGSQVGLESDAVQRRMKKLAALQGKRLVNEMESFRRDVGPSLIIQRGFNKEWTAAKDYAVRAADIESELVLIPLFREKQRISLGSGKSEKNGNAGSGKAKVNGKHFLKSSLSNIQYMHINDLVSNGVINEIKADQSWFGGEITSVAQPTFIGTVGTIIQFDLCKYPNPKIIAITNTACKYLRYIESCRNFLGYRDDEISIYTYRELLEKSRHYLQLALVLEKDYLSYLDRFETEEADRVRALQSVLKDNARVTLGNLHIEEAKNQVSLAALQYDKALHVQDTFQEEIDYQRSPLGLFITSRQIADQAMSRGQTYSGGNPYAAAAIAIADTIVSWAHWRHEQEMMDAQLQTLGFDVATAGQGVNLAQAQLAIAQLEQAANEIDLRMDTAYLSLIYNQVLGSEAYRYMYKKAKLLYKAYVDMAMRFAWLSERQLEFLRGVELNTIRFDYYHTQQQGRVEGILLAAETLQKDIEELNYQRELTEKNRIRVRKTLSLRTEYPILFGRFLTTGYIRFWTTADYPIIKENNGKLEYHGHRRYPDHFGYLQQRIDSVELRLIALTSPDQDIKLTLTNLGNSTVLIEKEQSTGVLAILPVVLKRPYQTIAFSQAFGQDTANVYSFNAPEGILKPFETIGLDTAWELTLDPISNIIDFLKIFDIQVIINYTAQYSLFYESEQRQRLPKTLTRTRVFSFKDGEFADAFYDFHNKKCIYAGFRDIRILTFRTQDEDFGPNEMNRQIEKLVFYLHSSGKIEPIILKYGCDGTNVNSFPYIPLQSNFENRLEEPPGSGSYSDISGLIDYSQKPPDPIRNLTFLFDRNSATERIWSIKIVPEDNPHLYWKEDLAGVKLNVRGAPINSNEPEVLYAKTGVGRSKKARIKVADAVKTLWDNYRFELKFKLSQGGFSVNWRVDGQSELRFVFRAGSGTSAIVNVKSYDGQNAADGSSDQWDNPFRLDNFTDQWFLLECVSQIKEDSPTKTLVHLSIDKHVVWEGYLTLPGSNQNGGINLHVLPQSEVYFDDLLVERINRFGGPIATLFLDTFDGKQKDMWEGLDPDTSSEPFITLIPDQNPALDLKAIENIVLIMDYNFNFAG